MHNLWARSYRSPVRVAVHGGETLRSSSRPAARAGLILLAISVIGACGDDSSVPVPQAGTGVAGVGGAAGMSGGGGGGSRAPEPVPCGSVMCYPPTNPISGLLGGMMLPAALPMPAACCVDEVKGECGMAASSGAACEPRAVPDSRCPGVDTSMLGAAASALPIGGLASGCCTPSGACGLDGMLFGRGCVENSEAKAMLGVIPLIGSLLPGPMMCDRPSTDADAGADDDAGS